MMLRLCFILQILTEYSFLNIKSYADPISTFFKKKNIGSIIIVTCTEKNLNKEPLKSELDTNNGHGMLVSVKENIDNLYPSFNSQHYRVGVYLNFSCNSSREVFRKMSNDLLLNMSFAVLIATDNYKKTINFLEDSTISFDSDVTAVIHNDFYDLYKTHISQNIISSKTGIYNNSKISLFKQKKRNNLDGVAINSGIVWTGRFPFNNSSRDLQKILDYTYEPELEFLSRYGFTIHKILEEAYNFRMNLSLYDDWGYFNDNLKIWDKGMFKAISRGDIDLGITMSRIFARRMDVSFYFPPFLKFRTCFIFKHPSMLADYAALIKPLTLDSWICTLSFVLLAGLIIWYIRSFNLVDLPSNDPDFASSFMLALGTLCQQGLTSDSKRLSMRVLYIFHLVACLLVYIFYGAAVVGFLLLPSPRTINTVEKLADSPITSYSENLAYHKTHFQGNFSEKAAKAYEAIKEKNSNKERWIELMAGIQKVKEGRAALYAQDINLYAVIEKSFSNADICSLTEIEIVLLQTSTVIRKKSPYKELLYQGMMLTRENGLLHRVMKTWQAQRPVCFTQERSPTVSFEATFIAHIIYSSGLLFSLIILAGEMYVAKSKKTSFKSRKVE